MARHVQSLSWFRSLRIWTLALAIGWTATIAALLAWEHHQIRKQAEALALVDARASFDRDLAFRRWAARHGGVYVPATDETPPNPHLFHVPDRDISTPSGTKLTLMNSAYISRQLHEWYEDAEDTRGHLTSLKPLRPENRADAWETEALREFQQGRQEVVSTEVADGKKLLRIMRPMVTEPECLKCHAAQGYQLGDIRGGISVSVPMEKYETAGSDARKFSTAAFSGVWLLGLIGIGAGGAILNRKMLGRQRADQARLDSERKFRAMFEQSFHFSGVLTPEGTVIEINRCALEFAGIQIEDVIGKPFWECPWWTHDPAVVARLREAIQEAAIHGVPARFETTHPDLQGNLRTIDFSLRPVKDDAGRTVLLVPEGNDITERRQAEEERHRLSEQLVQAQRLESIGRVAGGVAHDFNNMISPIMGYADILLTRKTKDDPDLPILQEIMKATLRARDLTLQLLACGRRQALKTRPMDLNAAIEGFQSALEHSLGGQVTLELRLAESLGPIEGDFRQIEQVILNLAINARDAMPGGGRLTIETASVTIETDDPRASEEWPAGRYVVMIVSDTGSGMDKHTAQRIFEPFFTTKPEGKGTGLGLPTVYGIVKQHRGQIEVDSEPGRGTTFRIYFPQIQAPDNDLHSHHHPLHEAHVSSGKTGLSPARR